MPELLTRLQERALFCPTPTGEIPAPSAEWGSARQSLPDREHSDDQASGLLKFW